MAVVRLIFRPCVGNYPMGVRFAAGNHPTGVRFAARNHPTGVRFAARNHPSVTFGDSSPQRGATPHRLSPELPSRGAHIEPRFALGAP